MGVRGYTKPLASILFYRLGGGGCIVKVRSRLALACYPFC